MPVEPLQLSPGPALREAFAPLRQMLEGHGPLLWPHAAGESVALDPGGLDPGGLDPSASLQRVSDRGEADVAGERLAQVCGVAVGTSGSTGSPKRAVLPTAALRASAEATHAVLGGPGRWLLTLPPHHIAGLQVVLRSLASGVEPVSAAHLAPFTAAGFTADVLAAARAGTPCRYVSLVPTQLTRILTDPGATSALAGFDAVLVGGAAAGSQLLARARAEGIAVVTTYGMSETAGGCVYDGRPLPGVSVELHPESADLAQAPTGTDPAEESSGRIRLGGPVVALGYLGRSADRGAESVEVFTQHGGRRWLTTDDFGSLERGDDGAMRLRVLGRIDDVIVTGGLKVAPVVVQEAVAGVLPAHECLAFGVPDPEWGQIVALALVAPAAEHERLHATWPRLVDELRAHLPTHALPRRLVTLTELPLRGPGKPDRAALRTLAAGAVGECENGSFTTGGRTC